MGAAKCETCFKDWPASGDILSVRLLSAWLSDSTTIYSGASHLPNAIFTFPFFGSAISYVPIVSLSMAY